MENSIKLNDLECLLVVCAMRDLIKNEDEHPANAHIAQQVIAKIHDAVHRSGSDK